MGQQGAWRDLALTGAPAAFVIAVGQAGLGLERAWGGSQLGLGACAVALGLPLLARRARPLVVAVVLALALQLQVAVGGSLHFGAFVAILVAAFAAGRWTTQLRTCLIAVAVLFAGAALAALGGVERAVDDVREQPDQLLFPLFYIAAAVGVGRATAAIARQSDRLRALNLELEAEREATARMAADEERLRISRQLHDSLAHTLTVTVVQAEFAEDVLRSDPDRAGAAMRAVQASARDGLAELRETLRVLRSVEDAAPVHGLADVAALAAVLTDAGLAVSVELPPDIDRLPVALSGELYWMVREALTNVTRHSAARTAWVRARRDATVLQVEVGDPGPASSRSPLPASGGHGITTMAERLRDVGGTLWAGADGDGWAVRAAVPVTTGVT